MPERRAPAATNERVRANMVRQGQGRDTAPELAVRRLLHARGLRYQVHLPLPGMPRRRADVAFPRVRVAVFIDGCYWHGCPDHARSPRSNTAWWQAKIGRNRDRDVDTDRRLEAADWTVVRAWEHEVPGDVVDRVVAAVRRSPGEVDAGD
jgi:DNA mismatch endonuclease, patch repair protein